jgi:hypothetical protein
VLSEGEDRDVLLVNIHDAFKEWAALLNPVRRAAFGETVAALLRDKMHRANVANVATELWNSLE